MSLKPGADLVKRVLERTASDTIQLLRVYRYVSWSITSLFYLLGPPNSSLVFKGAVVVALFFAIKTTLSLYEEARESRINLIKLVMVETIGIAFLLLPTGGLQSPFIWYALNPVLVGASFLPFYLCWLILIMYFFISGLISAYSQGLNTAGITNILENFANTLLVFILITLAFQLHARLAAHLSQKAKELSEQKKKLMKVNDELASAVQLKMEYIEHVSALYQSIQAFCSHDDRAELVKLFASYTSVLTGGLKSAFGLWEDKEVFLAEQYFRVSENTDDITRVQMLNVMNTLKNDVRLSIAIPARIKVIIDDLEQDLICVPVKSTSRDCGVLAVLSNANCSDILNATLEKRLTFLAKLSVVIFERINLEELADNLLLTEEQNRIANEIHDTVSQRLFSISFALHSISAKCNKMSPEELRNQVNFVQKSVNKAALELKESIYSLSSRKNGNRALVKNTSTYLNELSKLNNIEVYFEHNGTEDLINSNIRIALYRVIREATGNAIRHGNCSCIKVCLNITSTVTELTISDNGKGFERKAEAVKVEGLGLENMEKLIKNVNGHFCIDSRIGIGTVISCRVPLGNTEWFKIGGGRIESSFNR